MQGLEEFGRLPKVEEQRVCVEGLNTFRRFRERIPSHKGFEVPA